MTDTDDLADASVENEAAIEALEASWANGTLRPHVERLLTFVERNREEILQSCVNVGDGLALLSATKHLIIRAGVVHPPSEMRDQVQEIQDEIWIRGERGDFDRQNIAHEWTSRHAANWRRWRLREYLFVADRCAPDVVARLRT